jgi:hypothetical protein
MALEPRDSLMGALAVGAVVYGVYSQALPSHADIRTAGQNDPHIQSTERAATITSAAIVGAISLLAKDPTIFVVGSAMVLGLAWWSRYDNAVNPSTGKVDAVGVRTPDYYSGNS